MAGLDPGLESDTGVSTMIDESQKTDPSAARNAADDNAPPAFKPSRDFLLAFGALCTVMLAVAVDATSLSVALPTVSLELGGTALEAFWSGTSFLLASTVLQPSIAGLSHIFGRKYVGPSPQMASAIVF
jgi:hypothetical protein